MENTQTQKTPETLTPEQMESGKWYFLETFSFKWLIKFLEIKETSIWVYNAVIEDNPKYKYNKSDHCHTGVVKSIRPATKEEVLKYFPDEVFENVSLINEVNNSQVTEQQKEKWSEKIDEIVDTHVVQKLKPEPIELRPEDLVSGEVYRAFCDDMKVHRIFSFNKLMNGVWYYKMRNYTGEYHNNSYLADTFKFYHATPEEKALLLGGEELTDWEAKYNELKSRYEVLVTEAHKLDVLSGEMCDKYNELKANYEKLSSYNDELTERINKTETKNNQEKVYFYTDHSGNLRSANDIEIAKAKSGEDYKIYEAYCIGKKKSVLVSE